MRLNSIQLEAFLEVSQTRNFTVAAKNLHITQSALSQRIAALEKQLNATVIVRGKAGVSLTEIGEKVLRFCHKNRSLEEELLSEVTSKDQKEDSVSLRIAGYSSVMWSVVVPALSHLVRENPKLQINFQVFEVSELAEKLKSGAVDFILTTEKPSIEGLEVCLIGHEVNVCVHPLSYLKRVGIYLDHDEKDQTTRQFYKGVKGNLPEKRSFMDDIHGVLAGVSAGYGSAIVPRHLVKNVKGMKIESKRTAKNPVLLCYYKQAYYTKLHEKVVEALQENCKKILES